MVYAFKFDRLPEIAEAYFLSRRTVWETSDSHNILVFVLEGSCCVEIDSKKYIIKEGESFFVPKNKIYRRSPVNAQYCKMLYIHFDFNNELHEMANKEAYSFMEQNTAETENQLINENATYPKSYTIYLKHRIGPSEKATELAEKITKLLSKVSLNNTLQIVLLFCELVDELSKITQKILNDKNSYEEIERIPDNLKKAILYIKQNSFEKINVPKLAKYCCISESQLARYFKNTTGKTPVQYINEFKLNRAKNMLVKMPQISVKTVAESLGFDDQAYFSRLFSKTFGETPTAYRYRVTNFYDENEDK